jgi:hypothetical protein
MATMKTEEFGRHHTAVNFEAKFPSKTRRFSYTTLASIIQTSKRNLNPPVQLSINLITLSLKNHSHDFIETRGNNVRCKDYKKYQN